jgi:peroxiredoxin
MNLTPGPTQVQRQNAGKQKRPSTRLRLLMGIVLVILLLAAAGCTVTSGNLGGQTTAAAEAPQPATAQSGPVVVGGRPGDFALANLDGDTVALSSFTGQPVIINFWATWCGPCRLEMPEIQSLFAAHQEAGLVVLALNQDESPAQVEAYVQELGLTFPALLDVGGRTARAYGLANTLPSTVVVDRDGTVVAVHRGILTRAQLEGSLAPLLN